MENTDKVIEKVEEYGERFLEAVKELGPQAEWAFSQTIQAYSLNALLSIIVPLVMAPIFGVLGFYSLKRARQIINDKGREYVKSREFDYYMYGGLSSGISIICLVLSGVNIITKLSHYLYPVGSLILDKF